MFPFAFNLFTFSFNCNWHNAFCLFLYVPVKSKLQHPPPSPPRGHLNFCPRGAAGAFEFLEKFCSNPHLTRLQSCSNTPTPRKITRLLFNFLVASIMLLKQSGSPSSLYEPHKEHGTIMLTFLHSLFYVIGDC